MLHRKLHDLIHGYLDGGVLTDLRRSDDGRLVLYYTLRVKALSVAFAVLLGGVLFGYLLSAEEVDLFTVVVLAALVALCLFVVAEVLTAKASFDMTDLRVASIWQRKREASWSDLVDVRFNGFSQFVKFQFQDRSKLYVYQYMSGMTSMLEFANEVWKGETDD